MAGFFHYVVVGCHMRLKLAFLFFNNLGETCPRNAEANDPYKPEVAPGFYL
jgi:hypothetical protein